LLDLELVFATAPFFDEGLSEPTGHPIAFRAILLKPHSRSVISLTSADPKAEPLIDHDFADEGPSGRNRNVNLDELDRDRPD
jgi:choline dehydrogenase-like flavoprotein